MIGNIADLISEEWSNLIDALLVHFGRVIGDRHFDGVFEQHSNNLFN